MDGISKELEREDELKLICRGLVKKINKKSELLLRDHEFDGSGLNEKEVLSAATKLVYYQEELKKLKETKK